MGEIKQSADRGAARRARTDRLLSTAVTDQLGRYGYGGLTIEGVAAESGVAKTTIYRRWASKAEMVFDLAFHRAGQGPLVATGSLRDDVHALAERAVALVTGVLGRDVLPGLLADMAGDVELADRLRATFVHSAREDITAILDGASARGELTAPADIEGFHAALLGIPYARTHLLSTPGGADVSADELALQLLDLLPLRHS